MEWSQHEVAGEGRWAGAWVPEHPHPGKAPSRAGVARLCSRQPCWWAPLNKGSCEVVACGTSPLQQHDFSSFGSVKDSWVPSREARAGAKAELVGRENATQTKEALAWI